MPAEPVFVRARALEAGMHYDRQRPRCSAAREPGQMEIVACSRCHGERVGCVRGAASCCCWFLFL